ncbi:6-beta-glucosidase [Hexamita inflata]|uniref:6-beta-glucosidase n=1 Tax=Hexamita inflata TaxID=28002 RepID=A0AA86NU04_9EUKA|nr:6-beta-glucosidase [Hexamita inflata]
MLGSILAMIAMTEVEVFVTSSDLRYKITKMASVYAEEKEAVPTSIVVDKTKKYQTIDGFGASITDGSAWLFSEKLTDQQLNDTFDMLFSREKGIALSFLRQPIGSSDLSTKFFSYDDLCNQTTVSCTTPEGVDDKELKRFTIAHDRQYIIPMVKKAMSLNPDIKVMMTPWSPPGWMKSNRNMAGFDNVNKNETILLPEYYDAHANYLRKTIEAYQAEGIPIYAVTMQNEPMWPEGSYGGMHVDSKDQALYIKKFLYPTLVKFNLTATKIMVNDYNWDFAWYTEDVYADKETYNVVAGTSWHHYSGVPTAMSDIKTKYPDKDNWVTEASSFKNVNGETTMEMVSVELINVMRNHARSFVKWGMALDQNHQPHTGGCPDCVGVVLIDGTDPTDIVVKPNWDYYALGHASKFLYKDAVRIETNENGLVHNVAFQNVNGGFVLYTFNSDKVEQKITVQIQKKSFEAVLAPGAITTFVWNEEKGKMSTGALVGIICGSIAAVAVIIILVICGIKMKWCRKQGEETKKFIDEDNHE